jgi:hypothetical protein
MTFNNQIVDIFKTCNIICSIMDVVRSFDQVLKAGHIKEMTRLPGTVPQSLFLLLIVFGHF